MVIRGRAVHHLSPQITRKHRTRMAPEWGACEMVVTSTVATLSSRTIGQFLPEDKVSARGALHMRHITTFRPPSPLAAMLT
mmetsp:Transcript_2336/g.3515  ORF Transcript_2336/g.3515 Transcript_2336/m.3515 type:complete len:81 (+) Transcript_2336:264-506(+)